MVLGAFAFGTAAIFAQETKTQFLDEVVVTDSRFELKRENSGKTVITITAQEIANKAALGLVHLINTKSGIEINGTRSVAGQNLGYFIRGGNNRQVLILLDGVQVNDPSLPNNEFDLRLIDINTIESIEIVKGASSTLYGNGAATAVISITTKKAANKAIALQASSTIGTNQTHNEDDYNLANFSNNVSVNGTANKFTYLASFANQYTNGLSAAASENAEEDPFSRFNTNVKLGYAVSNNIQLSVYGAYDKFKTDIDGFPPPTYTIADTNDKYLSEQARVGVSSSIKYSNGSFHVNAAYTDIDRETQSSFSAENASKTWVVDAYNKYVFNDAFYTIVGFNYADYKTEFAEEYNNTVADPYVNLVYVSEFGLNVNAGARLNNHSEYGSHFVYNVNPSIIARTGDGYAKVFASYATSFIAPNLSQLFGYFGANPNLEPEENTSIEIGLEYSTGRGIRANALLFTRNEENTIIYTSQYENVPAEVKVRGVEIELAATLAKNLTFAANYTFTELREGVRLRLPKHKANVSLGYTFGKNYAQASYQLVGERTDTDFATFQNTTLDSYSIINLQYSRKLLEGKVKVFAGVQNLLNEEYQEIIGYSTLGRNMYLGFNVSL